MYGMVSKVDSAITVFISAGPKSIWAARFFHLAFTFKKVAIMTAW
jgi:hypothetical protein